MKNTDSTQTALRWCLTGIGLLGLWAALAACRTSLDPEQPVLLAISDPADGELDADALHAKLYGESLYPSAQECSVCHPDHFREWSVSPHAYAEMSPVFNTMQAAVTSLTNGTNADFCIRCHTPVGMALGEPLLVEMEQRSQTAREGVTCIVCHRINGDYGKVSGRFNLEKGDIHQPVYGPSSSKELQRILDENDKEDGAFSDLRVSPDGPGDNPIHAKVETSFFISQSSSCGSCHDVTSPGGFRLEEAFSEYKSSPSAERGESCQDCHMSQEEGKISSKVLRESAASMDGKRSRVRNLTSHYFAGPDYSILHPGLFPIQEKKNADFATITEWQDFDLAWGRDDFEKSDHSGVDFKHKKWEASRNRKKAHSIIYGEGGQMDKLEVYRGRQLDVLREGYQLGEVRVGEQTEDGLDFSIQVRNGTSGHNVPTGFVAERTLYLEVMVYDGNGELVFESGDLDPNGDVRDLHSSYVHNGALTQDEHLFSLQSKFMVRLFRGGEREQVLPLNFSNSPLLFNRPASTPVIATGRPPGARTHRVGLPPNSSRWADYEVQSDQLTVGPYSVKVRMIAGMVPVNLIEAIHSLGFDYGMNPRQVGDRVVAGRPLLWEAEFSLEHSGPVSVEWEKPAPGVIDWWQKPGDQDSAATEGGH